MLKNRCGYSDSAALQCDNQMLDQKECLIYLINVLISNDNEKSIDHIYNDWIIIE